MYSGTWMKSARTVQANPTKLPEPVAAHSQDVGDPYPQDHQAPVSPDYSGTDFARTVVQTPGLVLDAPSRSHDSPARSGVYRSQVERQAAQALGHTGEDRGWVRAAFAGRQSFQDDTTRYLESTWTGNGSAAPTPEAVQRGLNSLPQNNPEVEGYDPGGFRRGLRFWRFVDRKNRIDGRVYTAQQLLARDIRVPVDAPAPRGSTWGRSLSFSALARPMDTVAQAPALFRAPGSLTEAVIGSAPVDSGDGGIATDGMWAV
ncbi:hypothetical protein [Streptomyces albidoflavus]|uniref:hypothetical protein n=1 Tax=Streptomyces albidoflavus TaxID=1886 RepID=UPI00332E8F36